ncbi:hypothetical protein [Pseudomonas sp.]|uniref:hypothetical protein n=1 Tax=Pseudomonas sp. TaxID=306 RepID=UPI003C70D669
MSKAVLNIYSAVTIYFYLGAIPPAGQVSDRLKNEIKAGNAPRTDGQNPTRAHLSRGFATGKNTDLEACMKN